MKERVTGIGGIFFKCNDKAKMAGWYSRHLGLNVEDWGGAVFQWKDKREGKGDGMTLWSLFSSQSDYFEPSSKDFMINFRVDDLEQLLDLLEKEGVQRIGGMEDSEYGKFAWVLDPEGNKIELWQPPKQ